MSTRLINLDMNNRQPLSQRFQADKHQDQARSNFCMLSFRFNITYLCRDLKEQTETLKRAWHWKASRSLGSTSSPWTRFTQKASGSHELHPPLCLQLITALVSYLKCLPQIEIKWCADRSSKIVMSKICRWRWKKGWVSISTKLAKVTQSKTAVLDTQRS